MTLADALARYHQLEPRTLPSGVRYATKAGVRGYPELHPGVQLMLRAADLSAPRLLDATGSGGALALAARGEVEAAVVLETSRAALRCAAWALERLGTEANVQLSAGALWDAPPAAAELVCAVPATDRGGARVRAELRGAHAALVEGGVALFAMHKDQGAKRYEKEAAALFGEAEVLAKAGGWRLLRARKRREAPEPRGAEPEPFEAAGLMLTADPGVFAAGKLDPGTARLLAAVDWPALAGRRVLDLGCGYGLLALTAALAGAEVTAVDDDLLAVRSTHRNAERYGADVRALHSDVDSELQGERFDAVLTNPPFHVGKRVALEVPRAFLAAAHARLEPGGTLSLVANRALPYERDLAAWAWWERAEEGAFKVLRAVR
ncbi:methyltransferase [Truepera radiovictrix]|uniref:rRNA (Guanine-N(2)-)-methyltransferase n=1 Tax=Truepera radiovictrix (strain DSM 17093 / CIP 108686 / LMG 22925 / RQ-24) TaxID=649638 RepID=D7CQI5_TRURR|nr:methyltransferase [Truepera radiovictrix]ADI14969.1 rRNA (guanine-N(2)-)-methyltransferase [Truepera radiovictrix DSM 17093]WMT56476.1 methyltransferase [Truepera radiovictrix]